MADPKTSEKRTVYAEDVIQRIRDLAPEILGGWYNPDMENELEQLVCVVENTPTAAAQDALRWCNNGGCAMHIERPANGNCCGNYGLQLNRPPQSWCYVVGPGECHKELQEQVKATLNRIYPRKKVSDILPKPEILGQLAEELAEASAAASKLRRKIDGKNPTPKTLEECWEDLKKEIGDVMNSIDALTEQDPQNYHEFMSECGEYAEPKMERWLCRLNEQKEEHT